MSKIGEAIGLSKSTGRSVAEQFRPSGFIGGGISALPQNGNISVTSTPERQGLVTNIANQFSGLGTELRGLLPEVTPGFGRLSKSIGDVFLSAKESLSGRRREAVGNLAENLASRRIGGTSFGMDALSRATAEFEKEERALTAQEAEAQAKTFLQELDMKVNLMNQSTQASIQSFNTFLSELNLQADIGAKLSQGMTEALLKNNAIQAQLAENETGRFAGFLGAVSGKMFKLPTFDLGKLF
ncbi:MAG TPA: hypothetical protein VJ044_02815 [Candidatus Hodarchaeales archaeon]|nr:hypothetical protein [Candidatus Hodarchaeales archaeon]